MMKKLRYLVGQLSVLAAKTLCVLLSSLSFIVHAPNFMEDEKLGKASLKIAFHSNLSRLI